MFLPSFSCILASSFLFFVIICHVISCYQAVSSVCLESSPISNSLMPNFAQAFCASYQESVHAENSNRIKENTSLLLCSPAATMYVGQPSYPVALERYTYKRCLWSYINRAKITYRPEPHNCKGNMRPLATIGYSSLPHLSVLDIPYS